MGWGVTTKDGTDPSIPLKLLKVPYINDKKCIKSVPEEFQKFIAPDKICAGFSNREQNNIMKLKFYILWNFFSWKKRLHRG